MVLSNIVVVAAGGIGTLLELVYTWQLVQVKHICNTPIILWGDQWPPFVEWVQDYLLAQGMIDAEDLNFIHCVMKPSRNVLFRLLVI